jgi:hypothetical protein
MRIKQKSIFIILALMTVMLINSSGLSEAFTCSGANAALCCGDSGDSCTAEDPFCCTGLVCNAEKKCVPYTPPETCKYNPYDFGMTCGEAGAHCGSTGDPACCGGYDCYYNTCMKKLDSSCGSQEDCVGDCSGMDCEANQCCGTHAYPCTTDSQCCDDFKCYTPSSGSSYCVAKPNDVCGDNKITGKEQCELPGTTNNRNCCQSEEECSGAKLGTRDAFGNCGSTCGCNLDPFNYACVEGKCGATCDSNTDCAPKCVGNTRYFGGACDLSSSCSCSWNTEDCDLKDGWFETGNKQWIVDASLCKEREQKEMIYKDYSCAIEGCTYVNGSKKWVDTGSIRNKPDGTICAVESGICEENDICVEGTCTEKVKPYGTSCSDGQFCNGNEICNNVGQCIGGASVSCTDYNILGIAMCNHKSDSIFFTWDFRNSFTSSCNEVTDSCTTGDKTITHECSVLECDAECDATNNCAPITCSMKFDDRCSGKKLVDYNGNKLLDSKIVTDSCDRTCSLTSCECSDCYVSCEATPTESCVPGVCGAVCKIDSDCDDGNVHTTDSCLNDCTCKHTNLDFCGDGIIQVGETCELPGDLNDNSCAQTTSECSGKKLGTRDAFGNCDSSCGCSSDPFNYVCVKDSCGATCDDNSDCPDYCEGDVKHNSRTCDLSSSCSCSGGTTFDCNSLDGWYDNDNKKWESTGVCTEKELKEQEKRNYSCTASSSVDCIYVVVETKWVDTANTRNKPDGTVCDDGLFCYENDVCTNGQCGGIAKDCSGFNFTRIESCFNTPEDGFHFTWDFREEFNSVCDEALDKCTEKEDTITHTCSIEKCNAQCESDNDCYDKDPNTIDKCAADCVCEYTQIAPVVVRRSGGGGGSSGGSSSSSYTSSAWECTEWTKCVDAKQERTCTLNGASKKESQVCEVKILPNVNNVGNVNLVLAPVVEEEKEESKTPLANENSAPEFKSEEAVAKVLEGNKITGAVVGSTDKTAPVMTGVFFLILGGALLAFFFLKK